MTPTLAPTPWQYSVAAANRIRLPQHVMAAYRWNPLKDVFLDDKGRLWFADTDLLRQQLPPDPLTYGKRPPMFAHLDTKRRWAEAQHAEHRRAWEDERAEEHGKPELVR